MLRSIAGSPTGYKRDAALKIGKSAKLPAQPRVQLSPIFLFDLFIPCVPLP